LQILFPIPLTIIPLTIFAEMRDSDGLQCKGKMISWRLCGSIPENCAFLTKFSEPSFRMTNEKFSMTNSQFRPGAFRCGLPRCVSCPLRHSQAFAAQGLKRCFRQKSHFLENSFKNQLTT
jgi:hypothetical protein